MPTVTALCIYPVKSLKGINVSSAPICETGEHRHIEEGHCLLDVALMFTLNCKSILMDRRIHMGPTMDAHKARRTVPDAKANPQVSVGSTETLDAIHYLEETSTFLTGLSFKCATTTFVIFSSVAGWRMAMRTFLEDPQGLNAAVSMTAYLLLIMPPTCRMTLIVTSLPQEALSNEWGQLSPDAALTLNAPGMEPLHVPLKHSNPSEAELKQCTCWEWSGLARDEGT